jgi:hypothetical protein
MAPWLWLLFLIAVTEIAIYLPTHYLLRRIFKASSRWAYIQKGYSC